METERNNMAELLLPIRQSQVLELARQLSPQGKRALLRALIPELDRYDVLVDYGGERIRTLCEERGLDWDQLSEEERTKLIDDLLHEA
jgi:hypothetical protein